MFRTVCIIVLMFRLFYFSKFIVMLRGYNVLIFYLFIVNDENRVFSLFIDKCIKVSIGILNFDYILIVY